MRPGCSCDTGWSPRQGDAGGSRIQAGKGLGSPLAAVWTQWGQVGTVPQRSWELGQGPGLPGLMWVPMDVWGGVCTGDATAGQAQLNSPAGEGGRGTREGLWGVCLGPRAGRSPQFKLSMLYAGDTWLEDTEETSVLLWDTVEEVSSSPKGFLPQQIVVIMQLRNWGGDRNENGGTGGSSYKTRSPGWMD